MLKINRNTINSDITYWYSHLQREEDMVYISDLINKMLYRLETKRVRLMEKLDKAVSLHDFVLLEKMLYEVDTKIVQTVMKMQTTKQATYDRTISMLNYWLEEHGYKERYILWGQTLKVTPDTSERIKKMILQTRIKSLSSERDIVHIPVQCLRKSFNFFVHYIELDNTKS